MLTPEQTECVMAHQTPYFIGFDVRFLGGSHGSTGTRTRIGWSARIEPSGLLASPAVFSGARFSVRTVSQFLIGWLVFPVLSAAAAAPSNIDKTKGAASTFNFWECDICWEPR